MNIKNNRDYEIYTEYHDEEQIRFIMFEGNDIPYHDDGKIDEDTNSIHIWEGYISSIVGNPTLDGKGWIGLTRDYHECKGPWSDDDKAIIDVNEYYEDLKTYKNKTFEDPKTKEVYDLIMYFLEQAIANNKKVLVVRDC